MNKWILTGNIGKDSEVKDVNGSTVINFTVAHTEKWTDRNGQKQEKTLWVDCGWFTKSANIAQYIKKGAKVLVEGEPTSRAYLNKENKSIAVLGCNVRYLEILVFAKDEVVAPQQASSYQVLNGDNNDSSDDGLPF